MSALQGGKTRDGWGVFDESGFRLEDSPYAAANKIPFTICDLAGGAIAIVTEHPRTPEVHARLAATQRPAWIDAVGQATLESPPDAAVARIQADLVAPETFDRQAFAVAAAIVLFSHGLFDREPDRYEVRIEDQTFGFSLSFDDDTESWSADVAFVRPRSR